MLNTCMEEWYINTYIFTIESFLVFNHPALELHSPLTNSSGSSPGPNSPSSS